MPKVLITDKIAQDGIDLLSKEVEVDVRCPENNGHHRWEKSEVESNADEAKAIQCSACYLFVMRTRHEFQWHPGRA